MWEIHKSGSVRGIEVAYVLGIVIQYKRNHIMSTRQKKRKEKVKSKGKSKKVNHELTLIDTNKRVKKAEVGFVGV
jgi:hypothetical protein